MSDQTYRQDFEGGATLALACPELIDLESAFAIDSSGAHAFTGKNSLKLTALGANHSIVSAFADMFSGDVTLTAYINNGSSNGDYNLYARGTPLGVQPASYQKIDFGKSGISLYQGNAGVATPLNAPISGVTLPKGGWLCVELRCLGTAISGRVIRQDTGQFFVSGGAGGWSGTPQGQFGTATLAGAAGSLGIRVGDGVSCYIDELIVEPAVPTIGDAAMTLVGAGSTRQITAIGFTDPMFGATLVSSNTDVATVNRSGLVTAMSIGTAIITAIGNRDPSQKATTAVSVVPATTTYARLGSTKAFPYIPQAGYAILRGDGSPYAAWTSVGVFAVGTAGCASLMQIPMSGSYIILWSDGLGHSDFEIISPIGVEPPSPACPGGLNQSQTLALALAGIEGLRNGFSGTLPATLEFLAPDQQTMRIIGTLDANGNRVSPLTLNPPL